MDGRAEGGIDRAVHGRFFRGQGPGRCLEIGAARPDWLSIGAFYRAAGWDVLSVEPNPVFARMHRALGHDVAEVALSDRDESAVPFTVVDCRGAAYSGGHVSFESWSSLGQRGRFAEIGVPHDKRRIFVRTCRADTLLAERRPGWRAIDLVAVDVEGWELEALAGLDFARYRPKAVIVENLYLEPRYHAFMRQRGYALWRLDFPNEVFVRADLLGAWRRRAAGVVSTVQVAAYRARRRLADAVKGARRHPAGSPAPRASTG